MKVNTDPEPGPDRGAFQIGAERYRMEPGVAEYVLLARLTAGQDARPVFLFCGQRAITNQAATRYLARHHEKLARKHGGNSFCLLLKVVNSAGLRPRCGRAGPDVTGRHRAPAAAPTRRNRQRQRLDPVDEVGDQPPRRARQSPAAAARRSASS